MWASAMRDPEINLALPELDYENVFLLLLMTATQHPTPLNCQNISSKMD